MLRNIHPLLYPELLFTLGSMGHGDTLAIVDRNFPAAATAKALAVKTPLQTTTDVLTTVDAVLSVFPIDTYNPEEPAVLGMQVVNDPDALPDVVRDAGPRFEKENMTVQLIERHAFYAAAKTCYAVVRTIEDRPYGNFIIRKGVVV